LYPYLQAHCNEVDFHLNTNALITPPSNAVKRLKVSLDSSDPAYWDSLVGVRGAFNRVVGNIQQACLKTVTSITYTLTHENYKGAVPFARFAREAFPGLYAVFFSVYKGTCDRFAITEEDSQEIFSNVIPSLLSELDPESAALLRETMDEKLRLSAGVRFPETNLQEPCWLSLSERVYSWDGSVSACSHLYRDGIKNSPGEKHTKCLYGCNRRLVAFNELVSSRLPNEVKPQPTRRALPVLA
jgi:MoaA/NifB/PqqE/SkfB family radical SAM enzyme